MKDGECLHPAFVLHNWSVTEEVTAGSTAQ